MDPAGPNYTAAATSSAAASSARQQRRSMARRRRSSLDDGDDEGVVQVKGEWEPVRRRVEKLEAAMARQRAEELEAAVTRLRADKDAAERAVAALRLELEAERRAAETGTGEALLMIARLQRETSKAMIEAREFRRVAECRASRVRELHDRLAEAHALVAAYWARLLAHGIDPDDVVPGDVDPESQSSEHKEEQRRAVERVENDEGGSSRGGGETVELPLPPPPPAAEEFEDKYAVDVSCCAAVTKAVAEDLCARVDALEADSAAVRQEVKALRAEVVVPPEVAPRRLRRRSRDNAAPEKPRVSVLTVFKWFFSTVFWGMERSTSAASLRQEAPEYHQLVVDDLRPPGPAPTPSEIQGQPADPWQNYHTSTTTRAFPAWPRIPDDLLLLPVMCQIFQLDFEV